MSDQNKPEDQIVSAERLLALSLQVTNAQMSAELNEDPRPALAFLHVCTSIKWKNAMRANDKERLAELDKVCDNIQDLILHFDKEQESPTRGY